MLREIPFYTASECSLVPSGVFGTFLSLYVVVYGLRSRYSVYFVCCPILPYLVVQMGVEREVCISILNKCFQQQERGRDPEIYSCYASDDLKGYVYVEAHSQYAIKEALQGLRLVRTYGDIKIVPLQEMPAVFNSVSCIFLRRVV